MMRRVITWIRHDYPTTAPKQGHCYLVALCPRSGALR